MTPNPSVLISLDGPAACGGGLRDRLADWVRHLGFEPAVADDGPQALRWVQRHVFAASLLEWGQQGDSGVEVWRNVRPILGRRLVLMTREPRKDVWFEALREGVGAVLPMPPREAMVRAALRAATGCAVAPGGAGSDD